MCKNKNTAEQYIGTRIKEREYKKILHIDIHYNTEQKSILRTITYFSKNTKAYLPFKYLIKM